MAKALIEVGLGERQRVPVVEVAIGFGDAADFKIEVVIVVCAVLADGEAEPGPDHLQRVHQRDFEGGDHGGEDLCHRTVVIRRSRFATFGAGSGKDRSPAVGHRFLPILEVVADIGGVENLDDQCWLVVTCDFFE